MRFSIQNWIPFPLVLPNLIAWGHRNPMTVTTGNELLAETTRPAPRNVRNLGAPVPAVGISWRDNPMLSLTNIFPGTGDDGWWCVFFNHPSTIIYKPSSHLMQPFTSPQPPRRSDLWGTFLLGESNSSRQESLASWCGKLNDHESH